MRNISAVAVNFRGSLKNHFGAKIAAMAGAARTMTSVNNKRVRPKVPLTRLIKLLTAA